MLKWNAILLAALLVSAASLAAQGQEEEAKASDAEEVAALDEDSASLRGFCIEIRDFVSGAMEGRAATLHAAMRGVLESGRQQLSERASQLVPKEEHMKKLEEQVVKGQQELGKRLASSPFSPSALFGQVRGVHESVKKAWQNPQEALDKAEKYLVEKQRSLGKRLQESPVEPRPLFQSVYQTLAQAGSAAKGVLKSAQATGKQVMRDTCRLVGEFDQEIRRRFEELKKRDSRLAQLTLEEVECVTVASITSMRKACSQEKVEEA